MRYGISAAALIIHNKQVLLVNHRAAGQYDFWLPPGGRLEGEESANAVSGAGNNPRLKVRCI